MELYRRVRQACAAGMSQRQAAKVFSISRDTVAKMMVFSVPAGLSYDFPRLPCDKGAAARHPKYAGQRRWTDREWVGHPGAVR